MYHYEHILNDHRQRVARGVQNCERRRLVAERAAESVANEQDSADGTAESDNAVVDDRESKPEIRDGIAAARR